MDIYEPRLLMEAYSEVYQSQDVDNELYEQVVEFLINEGYAEDQDDADALIEELSDEEIEGVLDEVTGGGLIKGSSTQYASSYEAGSPAQQRRDTFRQKFQNLDKPRQQAEREAGIRSRQLPGGTTPDPRGHLNNRTPGQESGLAMTPRARATARAKSLAAKGGKYAKAANRITRELDTNKNLNEELDTYDLVLDHLISEGYADTEDAALQIMAHMSEEWVDGIIDEANRAERELGLTSRGRERARNLNQFTDTPIFYKRGNLGMRGNSDPLLNKAHKGMSKKREEEHKAGRHMRGDTGLNSRNRYQANKDHTDGYPSIVKRGEGPF